MLTIRIFLLSSIFSLSCSFSIIPSQNLQSWQTTYLHNMSPDELHFTANFLYLSYAVALAELKVRQFFTPLLRLHQSIRKSAVGYQECSQDLATLKTLLDRFSFVLGTRTIYAEMLDVCKNYYNEHTSPTIARALESIQLDAQTQLRIWADQHAQQTNAEVKNASEIIAANIPQLQGASELYQMMSKNSLPIEIPRENEPFRSVIVLDTIIKSNHKLQLIIDEIVNAINQTTDNAEHIITAGAQIYKNYYTAMYTMIMSPTSDKKYATTMFSMHDLLPEEYKTLLPDPDHVFEHMLHTAKLYTQTELLQKQ